jgi:hypothetical protein
MTRPFKIIYEGTSEDVNRLKEVYANNKQHALVIYKSIGYKNIFIKKVLYCYEENSDDFSVIIFKKNYGISTTCKMFSNQEQLMSIIYKNKKLYFRNKQGSKHCIYDLTINRLYQFFNIIPSKTKEKLITLLVKKFPWLQILLETSIAHGTNINTIIKNKLFSLTKLLSYIFKENKITCKVLLEHTKKIGGYVEFLNTWKEYRKSLINTQLLRLDFLESSYFIDSIRLASALNKKINCKWSERRLKEEHDKWTKEYTRIILSYESDMDLKINQVFIDFAEYSDYFMPTTNKLLYMEGLNNKNCVATYISKIEDGACGIYHYRGCTIEIGLHYPDKSEIDEYNFSIIKLLNPETDDDIISLSQIKSFANTTPTAEITEEVNNMIHKFNDYVRITGKKYTWFNDLRLNFNYL